MKGKGRKACRAIHRSLSRCGEQAQARGGGCTARVHALHAYIRTEEHWLGLAGWLASLGHELLLAIRCDIVYQFPIIFHFTASLCCALLCAACCKWLDEIIVVYVYYVKEWWWT